jgi:glycine C-acetyltransferase
MLYDAKLSQTMADELLSLCYWVLVVPKDKARIRVQLSAAHQEHLESNAAFIEVTNSECCIIII